MKTVHIYSISCLLNYMFIRQIKLHYNSVPSMYFTLKNYVEQSPLWITISIPTVHMKTWHVSDDQSTIPK